MKRRDFIKIGAGGLAALVVGTKMPWLMANPAYAAKPVRGGNIHLKITDALKHMVTDQTLIAGTNQTGPNEATCYFWIFADASSNPLPPDCPGPIIFATSGDRLTITVDNYLDEVHNFFIKDMVNFDIPAGVTNADQSVTPGSVTKTFRVGAAGTYLYYDSGNPPVNRVMGLHGAFIVMPAKAAKGHKFTPYDKPSPNVQQLFDDLGTASWWPGLAWQDSATNPQDNAMPGESVPDTPAFRQYVWVLHQASPKLFTEVGNWPAGQNFPAGDFIQKFLHDPFTSNDPSLPMFTGPSHNHTPEYFTISGQSGHFSHNNPYICPQLRVGEPCIIRILNAGLWLHSTHIHANHVFVLQHNNGTDPFPGSLDNPIWVDVYTANPLDTYDWLVPYMRPPDVPNNLGIGRDDLETSLSTSAGITWPPTEELHSYIPFPSLSVPAEAIDLGVGSRTANDLNGQQIDLAVHLSPLCFPMHDHSEPSQVAQGGNYNCGMISGINFTGDRKGNKGATGVINFPMVPPDFPGTDFTKGLEPPTVPFEVPSLP